MNRLEQLSVRNKIVLVRCSINVPISEKGEILDDFRLQKTIPTIAALSQKGAKVVLLGHLGRPKGREKRLSLKLVVPRLQELFLKNITFIDDCVGEKPQKATARMRSGDVILLENLRFHKGEVREALLVSH